MTQPLQNLDLLPYAEGIDNLLTSARADATAANKAATDAETDAAGLRVQLAAADETITEQAAQILALTPKSAVIRGLAPGGKPTYPAAWTAAVAALGPLDGYRSYEQDIPTDWASTHAAKVFAGPNPPTTLIQSLIWTFDAGPVSAAQAAATFAKQVPAFIAYLTSLQAAVVAGTVKKAVLCPRHEPEQADKKIDPASSFGPVVPKWLTLMAQYAPAVEPAIITMTYTSDARTPGDNEWVAETAKNVKATGTERLLTWQLLDGYIDASGKRTTPAAVFDEPIAYGKQLLPMSRQGVAEWGVPSTVPNRAQAITATAAHLDQAGMEMQLYFNSKTPWAVTGDAPAIAALRACVA
jgi:hypothetical protein